MVRLISPTTIPNLIQGGVFYNIENGGHGVLHWNQPLSQKYVYKFNFITVITPGIRLYEPQEYFSI